MNKLKRLFSYMGPYKRDFRLAVLLVAIETCFELIIPTLMADLIDLGVAKGDTKYMFVKGAQMALCALLALITGLTYARFAARAAYGWGAQIRKAEYERVQEYSFSNIDRFETSSLVTRMTSDVTVMQNAINGGLRPITRAPIMFLLGIIFSFTMNAYLAIIFMVMAPLLGMILFLIVRKVAPMYAILQKTVDSLNGVVEENVRAIRTVKAFIREEYEEEKFESVNSSLRKTGTRTNSTAVMNLPFFQAGMYICIILIMLIGGRMILSGRMEIGTLTGFLSYVMQVMNSMMMLSNVFLLLTRSLASATRISEVLDEKPSLKEKENPVEKVDDATIEFRHVSFKYSSSAKEETLKDINLKISGGETIGILGGTGSGKSTLVQLMERLYDTNEGEVLLGGINVKEYSLKTLRDAIGIVLQKNLLFSGSIRENLLWGDKDASDEEIWQSCEKAGAAEFLRRFPNGLDTDLGQGGVNVSGGQKQRLCIARKKKKKPRILIFDDSTSAVDTATEKEIRSALASLKDVTKIYIAQRISTVMSADRIVIMDDGRIVDTGSHEELMERCRIYQEIYDSQLKGGNL